LVAPGFTLRLEIRLLCLTLREAAKVLAVQLDKLDKAVERMLAQGNAA
jgi:hypothetical protein